MPRLWTDAIDTHRRDVRTAILDATAQVIAEHGLLAVSMSQIAERAGIGRATLYKYFPDLTAIVHAWHERHLSDHIEQLRRRRDETAGAPRQLHAVLDAYATLLHQSAGHARGGIGLAADLHDSVHVAHAQQELRQMLTEVLTEAATAGHIRADVPAAELAEYCLHALSAARALPTSQAVLRLVHITLDGLKP